MEKRSDIGTVPTFEHVLGDRASVVLYKHGARIHFQSRYNGHTPPPREDDDERLIKDQSKNSRMRAAFAFGNAGGMEVGTECDWLAMTTLTWHVAPSPELVKWCLDKLRREWRRRWLEPMDGWVMEMQARGVPHFHVFHAHQSQAGKIIAGMPTRIFRRKGRPTEIVGGSFENWLVQTWLSCTGEKDDLDALAFARGGICEIFRTPDAAGRYIAKESCKRQQKILPPMYEAGLGRWWWLNPRWHPQPVSAHSARMVNWPWAVPLARVWDKSALADVLAPAEPLPASVGTGRTYVLRRRLAPRHEHQRMLRLN